MSFTSQHIARKSDIEKYKVSDEHIYRNIMRMLVSEAPMSLLSKIFDMTKVELNESEIDFRVKI